MKTILYILTFGLVIFFFSSGQRNEERYASIVEADMLKMDEHLGQRNEIGDQNEQDDPNLDEILTEALKISTQNINKNTFHNEYELISDDGCPVKVEISLGRFFTKSESHLLIRRSSAGAIYFDIYSINGGKFEKVITHEQSEMTYTNDTIQDINGDGLKDFVVNWYGSSGCCLKSFSDIYLLRANKKTFSDSFEFINPTFSPKERIIRGICYGYAGDTDMYKYKWNGEQVDTLEYISYEKNDKGEKTGKIIISNGRSFDDELRILKRLDDVPNEYKKIEGYNWFTGIGYE